MLNGEITAVLNGYLAKGLAEGLALVAYRLLPIVGYVLLTRRIAWRSKLVVGLLYGLLCAGVERLDERGLGPVFLAAAVAYSYFITLGSLLPRLPRLVARGSVSRGALFTGCVFTYMLLPLVLVPGSLGAPVYLLAWDVAMSSYSYCVDCAERRRNTSIRECLFFLLVNPTLVFAESGRRVGAPSLHRAGALRVLFNVLLGVFAMYLHLAHQPALRALGVGAGSPSYALWLLNGTVVFFALYLSHTSYAGLRIGVMRLLGYEVPEQYNYPFLARNPLDFWRRWNVYVGTWAMRYVFNPLSLKLARGRPKSFALWARGAALFATFVVVGLLHELTYYTDRLGTEFFMTLIFTLSGATLVAWIAAEAVLSAAWNRALGSRGALLRRLASHAGVVHLICGAGWLRTTLEW